MPAFSSAIRAEIEIEAPIAQVWSVLRDIPNYAAWNPFTPRIDTTLALGTPVMLHVAMKKGKPLLVQKETMSRYEEGRLMAWGDAFLTGMFGAIFVAFVPQWLATWSDQRYLKPPKP